MEAEPASGQSVQRYYDPVIGRFDSVDAVTALQGGQQHFNRYDYAYDSPYKFTDPDGRCGKTEESTDCPSSFSMIGPRLLKALKLDIGIGPSFGAGFKVGKAEAKLDAHATTGVSLGGESGLEPFSEASASMGVKAGPVEGSRHESIRAGADPKPIREHVGVATVSGDRGSAGADSSGTISFEVSPFVGHIKLSVDLGGVLFAFFGPSNDYVQDGIK